MRIGSTVLTLGLIAVALIIATATSKNAAAQTGVCVVYHGPVTISCQNGSGCHSSVTIELPQGGYGAGVFYSTALTDCCGNKLSYITKPDGACRVGAAPLNEVAAAESRRYVFVRECDGRFKLYPVNGGTF